MCSLNKELCFVRKIENIEIFLKNMPKSFGVSKNNCTFASAFALKLRFFMVMHLIFDWIYIDREVVVQEAGAAYLCGSAWVNEPFNSFIS